jgi:hypothetical protein
LVAHSLWERGAVGSNPATPTDVISTRRRGRDPARRPGEADECPATDDGVLPQTSGRFPTAAREDAGCLSWSTGAW